jgi:hypothetical protein
MALKSSDGRQTHHTQAGLLVCCERALKSAGERTTHGGYRCGDHRGKPPARERSSTSGSRAEALHDMHRWRRFGGGGVLRFPLCWRIVDREYRLDLRPAAIKSKRFALLAGLYLNIKCYIIFGRCRAAPSRPPPCTARRRLVPVVDRGPGARGWMGDSKLQGALPGLAFLGHTCEKTVPGLLCGRLLQTP